jgi:two-component system, OmpR family, phosphate regulon sensor histidine kinase PhoR
MSKQLHGEARHEPSWRVVVDAIADPAIVIDPRGTILHFNPQSADLYPRARPGFSITTIVRTPELLTAIEEVRSGKGPIVVQLHDRVPMTRRLSAICSAIVSEDPQAGVPAILIIVRDVTDQEKHAKMRTDFIANASHELRTPLASLKVIVETLQGPARNDPAARDRFISMMTAQTSRMARLIDDLLSLSRAEMKEHLPPRDRVELRELLEWVGQSMEPLAHANGVELTFTCAEIDAAWVRGERDELAQVVLNLVQNAIKYGGSPGKVRIALDLAANPGETTSHAVVSVTDTGPGIAPEHIPRLTERFYRVNVAASREKGGTGLGLAIVKYIVNRHRGELVIESKKGVGSRFLVRIPLLDAAQSGVDARKLKNPYISNRNAVTKG